MEKVPLENEVFDTLLEGGVDPDIITTVYGPAGVGKTLFCLLLSKHILKTKKVLYIDSEGSFSPERFKQLCPEYEKYMQNFIFLRPLTFTEQENIFATLNKKLDDQVGLLCIDTLSMLYRLALSSQKNISEINQMLTRQVGILTEIARKKHIPIIIANQVYSSFDQKDKVNLVGGNILKERSKCLIELQKYSEGKRKAILHNHRSLPEGKEVRYIITREGCVLE